MPDRAENHAKALTTLERLLEVPTAELGVALSFATDAVADALEADKVDAFLYDPTRDTLVAIGSSHQPLSAMQHKLGLDVLPISNGGRVVWVYEHGETFVTGRLDLDAEELRGPKEALGIRSKIGVPLRVGGELRGMVMIASQRPEFYSPADVKFAESVVRWVGLVAHRAELIEEIGRNAAEQGRRAAAEELVTVLAHDLRNHLNPIDLRLQVLRRRAHAGQRAADVGELDTVRRSLDRLRRMVDDLLDVARVEQGLLRVDLRPIELVTLVEETAALIESPEHLIEVRTGEPSLVVEADAGRIRQCLENLLSNAVKHSPRGSPVAVEVLSQPTDDAEMAKIVVVDEGPGIPDELIPRIFERFVSGAEDGGGLGLGLYLAKSIAVLHGGTLEVSSTRGRGARFTLTLPCASRRSEPD
jgi:two-component system, OmpR family, sensor kinase